MASRGGFSFVAMLVINPIVILFYQNCSMSPITYAKNTPTPVVVRTVASETKATPVKPVCDQGNKSCAPNNKH